jgi:small multidrug resistance pump
VAYVVLLLAIAFEVTATSLLKATEGFSKLLPTLACLGAYAVSFALLSRAVRHLPVGLTYAVWSGLGTAAVVAIGAVFLGETLTVGKVVGVALVISGVVILGLVGAH